MKGFTLFSGGGGVDLAMQSLGVDVIGGIEYDDKIASVARANGLHTTTAGILETNPAKFDAMDWLHASPPCPNFSNAKTGGKETENDLTLACKVAEWVTVHRPQVFTLENVIAYRKSKSWRIILEALSVAGYWVDVAHVNFADYGVAQTRRRMIVRAQLGAFIPYLRPTHDENGANGLPRWIGWHEAVEDLIQGAELWTPTNRVTRLYPDQMPSIALINTKDTNLTSVPNIVFEKDRPSFTITKQHGRTGIAMYINGVHYKTNTKIQSRLQSLPDNYQGANFYIIGNAVPPVGFASVCRDLI